MTERAVVYVGFYDRVQRSERDVFLSCVNKMDYVIDSLNAIGRNVIVLSPAWVKKDGRRLPAADETDERMRLILPASAPYQNRAQRKQNALKSLHWLFWQLMRCTDSNTDVIVYHSTMLSLPVRAAKRFRHFRLILEIEEAYQDVRTLPKRLVNYENRLVQAADSYILTTEGLAARFDIRKPYVLLYGAYRSSLHHHAKVSGAKIHLLYSGIIDEEKKGAFNAVECMRYLDPAQYDLHIAGYGSGLEALKLRMEELRQKGYDIVFDGLKRGEEYDRYLEQFDIGLNTPSSADSFAASAFPSKVLFYLCAGMDVVSCRLQSLEQSKFGRCIHFYAQDTPQAIAETVKACGEGGNVQIPDLVRTLERDFRRDLAGLLAQEGSRS